MFAPPKPAAPGGKGGPPSAPAAAPIVIPKTPIERLIEKGTDFPLGPPPGNPRLIQGAPRDALVPKLQSRIDVFAKKLREYYLREGIFPDAKTYIEVSRYRNPDDTIEKLLAQKLVAGVIEGREEYKELDLVFPWTVPHLVERSDHPGLRSFYVKHLDGEEIRVTLKHLQKHVKSENPLKIEFQRYIVGRPNLLCMPIYPVQEERGYHHQAGADLQYNVMELYVWSFGETYPARIEVDCQDLTPRYSIKIGDVEKMLPDGVYLHKMYNHQKFRSVVSLKATNLYMQRNKALAEQEQTISDERKKMQMDMVRRSKRGDQPQGKAKEKHVKPMIKYTSKDIMNMRKEKEKETKAAEGKKK